MRVVNVAELAPRGWRFVADEISKPGLDWRFHSSQPRNALERIVRYPKLSRYRAAWETASDSRGAAAVISHMPIVTAATAEAMQWRRSKSMHLAVSFNFTDLPSGPKLAFMRRSLQNVDRFIVYSTAEKQIYSDLFRIDSERFHFMHWPMDVPIVSAAPMSIDRPYISAVGGEARDYQTLIEAMRGLSDIELVIVTRPGVVSNISLPSNITILTDVSNDQYWGIVNESEFTILPLRDSQTNCGHITLVGSMLLNKAIIVTESSGIADYTGNGERATVIPPRDRDALRHAIEIMWNDQEKRDSIARAGYEFASKRSAPDSMVDYVKHFLESV